MGVVIGRMDSQVEKIFLGNNLTRSTKNYDKGGLFYYVDKKHN